MLVSYFVALSFSLSLFDVFLVVLKGYILAVIGKWLLHPSHCILSVGHTVNVTSDSHFDASLRKCLPGFLAVIRMFSFVTSTYFVIGTSRLSCFRLLATNFNFCWYRYFLQISVCFNKFIGNGIERLCLSFKFFIQIFYIPCI